MLNLLGSSGHRGPGLSRRVLLKIGALGIPGFSLPALDRLRAAQADAAPRDTAVILYWMAGGPSHLDTYDMKPQAPAEVRGPFQAAATRVPGMHLCELLPRHAELADRFALLRSLHHANADHFDAAHWVQTGYHEPRVMGRGQPYPAQGAVVSALRGAVEPGAPAYVCIPEAYSARLGFFQRAAYLGSGHDPMDAGGEPGYRGKIKEPQLALPEECSLNRLENRRDLLAGLDRLRREVLDEGALADMDASYRRAFELLLSRRAQRAFDLAAEPPAVRQRYGDHPWGKASLLARRLVEAGVTFVTINHYEADVDWWDDHFHIEKNLRKRLPMFDQALGSLIEDLSQRGLDRRVLVIAVGEFGRAPRIDTHAGRGHWPRAFSALLFGGGVRGGQVVGATTRDGGHVDQRGLLPGDLLATIYHVLGIDPQRTLPDATGRPIRLVEEGSVIRELF